MTSRCVILIKKTISDDVGPKPATLKPTTMFHSQGKTSHITSIASSLDRCLMQSCCTQTDPKRENPSQRIMKGSRHAEYTYLNT